MCFPSQGGMHDPYEAREAGQSCTSSRLQLRKTALELERVPFVTLQKRGCELASSANCMKRGFEKQLMGIEPLRSHSKFHGYLNAILAEPQKMSFFINTSHRRIIKNISFLNGDFRARKPGFHLVLFHILPPEFPHKTET